jgi:hypothetical protein
MTYTNYNQVESPIVYISKKYYTTDTDGTALSPEETSINSFKITVS